MSSYCRALPFLLASLWIAGGLGGPFAPSARAESAATLQAASHLSASQAVRAALANDLSLRSARRALALQQQAVRVAEGDLRPKAGTSASTERVVSGGAGALQQTQASLDVVWLAATGATLRIGRGQSLQRIAGLPLQRVAVTAVTATQPLLRGFGPAVTEARLLDERSALRVALAGVRRQAAQVIVQVVGAYVAAQKAQAAVAEAVQAQALAQRVHEFNQAIVAAGRSPAMVLLQSEADLAAAALSVAQARNEERIARRALMLAIGSSEDSEGAPLSLQDELDLPGADAPPDEAAFVQSVLAESPELLAAQEAVQVARRGVETTESNLLPRLDVSLSRSVPSGGNPALTGQGAETRVGLSFETSFDGAQRKLARSTAAVALRSAQEQLVEAERQVRAAAVDAVRNWQFALSQQSQAAINRQLASQQLEAEVARQRLGYVSQLDLSVAQRTSAAAAVQLRDARVQAVLARIEVARLGGSLLRAWEAEPLVQAWIQDALDDSSPP